MLRRLLINRYLAAIRLERARQIVRELIRYGYPVTVEQVREVRDAERAYLAATRPTFP